MFQVTAFLDYITAHAWIGWLVFGLLSLVLSHRSQIDGWAEKHPRLAGAMKLMRALGLDPWLVVQSASLIVKGRLPVKLQAAQIVAAQGVPVSEEVKEEVKAQSVAPPKPPSDTPLPPIGTAAAICVAILLLFAPGLMSCSSAQTPQAQAAQARNFGRVAYAASAHALTELDKLSIAWFRAQEHPTSEVVDIADKVNAGLHAARDALAKARPWLEGGPAGSREKEALLDALDGLALVSVILADSGADIPSDVGQGLAAARSLLGGGS